MTLKIENPANVTVSLTIERVLHEIFGHYQKIIILQEFGNGLSGGRVLEVRPIRPNGTPELPTIVKIAPVSLIQQEWQAYQQHVHHRLPYSAQVTTNPVFMADVGWGGLRYAMSGGATFEVLSLADYWRQTETTPEKLALTFNHLLRIMGNVWDQYVVCENFQLSSSYDQTLPVNLLIQPGAPPPAQSVQVITPDFFLPDAVQPDDWVCLSDFVVHKTNFDTQSVTLKAPYVAANRPTYFMRCKLPLTPTPLTLEANQPLHQVEGQVMETRMSRLYAEVRRILSDGVEPTAPTLAFTAGVSLPNPLLAVPHLLAQQRHVHFATIHGDLNLGNILVEPETGTVSVIDFADAREDHVLHDFLRLETEVITRFLPELFHQEHWPLALTLGQFYWQLHQITVGKLASGGPELPPALQKPWQVVSTLRYHMRRYLYNADDLSEYYQGLVLYLLGALKFKNLDTVPEMPLPKQLAFWSAALVHCWLIHPPPDPALPPAPLLPLLEQGWHNPVVHQEPPSIAEGTGRRLKPPMRRLPALGELPARSLMPYNRNKLFVGRRQTLLQIAQTVEGQPDGKDRPVRALAITGLGGIGKTQLTTEFVYRYGRFFDGGVYWLSFADPRAVPAEIAACGRMMQLRPDYDSLKLEEQGRLVTEAWQNPQPRLLIFDNCEDPELLARWRPQQGGCCLLVTSRRADWSTVNDIMTLALDVFSRSESIELLHAHRPDADVGLLDAIAQEVEDLPLALHLAGSFLGRYRRTIDAQEYLEQLRQVAVLEHDSLESDVLSPTGHAQSIRRTIALSFNQLKRQQALDHLALATLAHMACLAPGELIPLWLLRLIMPPMAELLSNDPAAIASDTKVIRLEHALARLGELGLVRVEDMVAVSAVSTMFLRLHRLVIAFVQSALQADIAQFRPAIETALSAEAGRVNDSASPAALLPWQAHLRTVTNDAFERDDERAASLCSVTGEHFRQIGDYERARRCLERVVIICQKVFGEEHVTSARCATNLGVVAQLQGELNEAQAHFEHALTIQEKLLGVHADTANTLNQIGFVLQLQKAFDLARQYHQRALTMRQQLFGEEHPAIAESLCNLAFLEFANKNLQGARPYLERALQIQQGVWGEHHPETARVLNNLGELLFMQHEYTQAETMLTQALTTQQKELGIEHPETGRVLVVLGQIHLAYGQKQVARANYERALKIFSAHHGANHYRTQKVQELLQALDEITDV